MGTRIEAAEHLEYFRLELHAEAFKPGDGVVGVFAENTHAFRIPAEVARFERLLGVKFGTVLDALFRLTNRVRRVDLSLSKLRIAARERKPFQHDHLGAFVRRLDGRRHTGAARTDYDHVVRLIPFFGYGGFRTGRLLGVSGRHGQKCSACAQGLDEGSAV